MCDKHSGVGVRLSVVCVINTVVWVCACQWYVWETQWCGCVPVSGMCGKHSGVGVCLSVVCVGNTVVWVCASKRTVHTSFMCTVHCAAHRVALVSSNAARDTQKVADCRRILNNVHFCFKNSAQRYERLMELHVLLRKLTSSV